MLSAVSHFQNQVTENQETWHKVDAADLDTITTCSSGSNG